MPYKTTVVIYSEFNANFVDLDKLGWEAIHGSAIATEWKTEAVDATELPEDALSFFGLMDIIEDFAEDLPLKAFEDEHGS